METVVHKTKWGFAALYGVVGAAIVSILVLGFIWPAATAQPQNLPVAIAGPADQVTTLEGALAEQDPSPFDLHEVTGRDEAVTMIEDRQVYGAILLGQTPEVLVGSAASPVAAQALRGVAVRLQTEIWAAAQQRLTQQFAALGQALAAGAVPQLPSAAPQIPTVVVTDVVPLSADDATGAGLGAAAFPLVLGGLLAGVLLVLLVSGVVRRLLGLAVFAVVAGAGIVLVLQTWFGVLQGPWILNALAAGLGVAATGAVIIGFNAVMGPAGIGVGAVITMLIGNPLSAAAIPWQFLPTPWGAIGQGFVPGASATLLRSISYFPDASTLAPWLTLTAWTVGGVLLALVGRFRSRADVEPPVHQLEA
ncbi:hypothetical protein ABCS02_25090 [Microbacterium sp. X-17]|uniref:hypothetical protein n=1 Tax=Microbacterium sp. X-17 TaxID=3144404 RepID=UPI0031F5B0A3